MRNMQKLVIYFKILLFSPDSDSYRALTSNNNELAVLALETGVPVPGAGCGAGAGCCGLAGVVGGGAGRWQRAWWRQGAGAGCWCWVL